jgi:RHS repeat-associated protein
VSQRRSGTSHFYLPDEIGTIQGLLNSSESLTDSYLFGAFGDHVATSGTTTNPHTFVGGLGYYHDPDLDLPYVRSRWLRPEVGGWLSADPVEDQPPYNYVGYAPTFRTDPSGEAWYWWLLFLWKLSKAVCVAKYFYIGRYYVKGHDPVHVWAFCQAARFCGILGIGDWIYYSSEVMQEALKMFGIDWGSWARADVVRNRCGANLETLRRQGYPADCLQCAPNHWVPYLGSGWYALFYLSPCRLSGVQSVCVRRA